MADIKDRKKRRQMRHLRVRRIVSGTPSRPRLVVFKSAKHVYVQVVDDSNQKTITGASSLSPELKEQVAGKNRTEAAKAVGALVSTRMKEHKVEQVVFDRNGYKFHGVVKALAEVVRAEKLLA